MYGYAKATKDDGFEYYDDGFEYYEMLFVYVDYILALSHRAKNAIAEITADSNKDRSVNPPEIYSARLFQKVELHDDREQSPKTIRSSFLSDC